MFERLGFALLWSTNDAHAGARMHQSPTEGLDAFAFIFGLCGWISTGPFVVIVAVELFGLSDETLGFALYGFVSFGLPLVAWLLSLWRQWFLRDASYHRWLGGHVRLTLRPLWQQGTWTWAVLAQTHKWADQMPRKLAAVGTYTDMAALLACGADRAFALYDDGQDLPALT